MSNNTACQRIVTLVDMDCFYCQVEARLDPSLKGKPVAVVQYNQWKGGGIIAVNYEARYQGVTRGMRGDKAKEKCPDIELVAVPSVRGKADLSKYRDAGAEVAEVFCKFSDCVQRASVDEAYIDLTKAVQERINTGNTVFTPDLFRNTYVIGYCDIKDNNEDERGKGLAEWLQNVQSNGMITPDYQLMVGGLIIEELRAAVFKETGFHCSAGVAHNKILAKLAAGLHKPQRQTILPHDCVPELYSCTSVSKVRNLGGKLGEEVMEKLDVKMMAELLPFSLKSLQQKFDEKTGSWLFNIARGIDVDPVTPRLVPKSIGCCKNFPGKTALGTKCDVEKWLFELSSEVAERLVKDFEDNKRRPKLMTVSFSQSASFTKSGPLSVYDPASICNEAMNLLKKFNSAPSSSEAWLPPLNYLGISVGKFTEENSNSIQNFFKAGASTSCSNITKKSETKSHTISPAKTKPKTMFDSYFKKDQSPATTTEEETSFFKKYLARPTENKIEVNEALDDEEDLFGNEDSNDNNQDMNHSRIEEEEHWISLSEICPNLDDVDIALINLLPTKLADKLNQKLLMNKLKEITEENKAGPSIVCDTNKCIECDKMIAKHEMDEHMDYHAAMKLHESLNKPVNNGKPVVHVQNGSTGKRKRGRPSEPGGSANKCRSITSFFKVLPKS